MDQLIKEHTEFSGLMVKPDEKITYLGDRDKRFEGTKLTNKSEDDIITEKKGGNVNNMNSDYVTHNDIKNLEEKFDLKMQVAVQPLEAKIDNLNTQLENLPTKIENIILKEREYQDSKRKETQRFFWGTIGIGVVGVLIGIASILVPILNNTPN